MTDGQTDGHNYDPQDRASIAASRDNYYHVHMYTAVVLAVEGGAVANLYAVLVARHDVHPPVKHEGLADLQSSLVVFQSNRV